MKIKVVLNQENLGDLDMPKEEIMEEEEAGRPGNELSKPEGAILASNEENLSLVSLPISDDAPAPSPVSSMAFLLHLSVCAFMVLLGV